MTIEIKQSRSTSPSTSSSFVNTTQPSLPSNDAQLSQSQSRDKNKGKANAADLDTDTELTVGLYPANSTGDISRIRCYGDTILYNEQSTLELRRDGSIVITPPHHLPTELISLVMHQVFEAYQERWSWWSSHSCATLYQCTLVSRSFCAIANPLLWRAPIFRNAVSCNTFLNCISSSTTISLQRQETLGQYIQQLELNNHFWTNNRLKRLLSHSPHLTNLSISVPTRITDTGFLYLSHYGHRLTSLILEGIYLSNTYFEIIGQHLLPHLRILELIHCLNILPDYLTHLLHIDPDASSPSSSFFYRLSAPRMPSPPPPPPPPPPLERLVVDCMYMTDDAAQQLVPVIQQCHDLTHLTIPEFSLGTATQRLLLSTACWPQLTKLHLDNCNLIDDDTWIPFILTHQALQIIRLNYAYITDASLESMALYLPFLSHLVIHYGSNITPHGIRQLVRHAHLLLAIELFCCQHIHCHQFPEIYPIASSPTSSYVALDQSNISKMREFK